MTETQAQTRTSQVEEMRRVRCVIVRGGTSRAIFVREADLPRDAGQRDRLILALFGSPDKRQIDGLGGADAPTSKLAIIGPPSRSDADVDYTFVQVGVIRPTLDFNGNCGNISAGVGPYAIEEGFVRATDPVTTVRIHNTNTGKILVAEIPTRDGRPLVEGDFAIAGVPGTGARITLDYADTVGAVTGTFFPTGNVRDVWDTEAFGSIDVTVSDVANPVVYVKASDIGLTGTEGPEAYDSNDKLNAGLEEIRGRAAVACGFVEAWGDALEQASMFPLVTVVHGPDDYETYGGGAKISADEIDIIVRMQVLQRTHPAYAGTGTANLGATALVPGTVVNDVLTERAKQEGVVRFGHPGGVTEVTAAVAEVDGKWRATKIGYDRTARRVMEGYAFVRESQIAG